MERVVVNPPFWLLEQAGMAARSTQTRLTAADNGGQFNYVVTARFEIVFDQHTYPREKLTVSCDPANAIDPISNLPSLDRSTDWVVRYTGVVPGSCTIRNDDFSVNVLIVPLPD